MTRFSSLLTYFICLICVLTSACAKKTSDAPATAANVTTVNSDQVLGQVPVANIKQIRLYNAGGFPNPFQTDYGFTIAFDGVNAVTVNTASGTTLGTTSCSLNLNANSASQLLRDLTAASTEIATNVSGTIDSGNTILEIDLNDGSIQKYRFLSGDAFTAQPVVISATLQDDLRALLPAMTCSQTN